MKEKSEKGVALIPLRPIIVTKADSMPLTVKIDVSTVCCYEHTNTPILYQQSNIVASALACEPSLNRLYHRIQVATKVASLFVKLAYLVEKYKEYLERWRITDWWLRVTVKLSALFVKVHYFIAWIEDYFDSSE